MRGLDITWRGRCWTGARSENAGGIKSSGGDGGHSGGGGSGFGRGGAERGKCDGGGSGKKLTAAGGCDWPARSRCTQKLMAWLAIAQLEPCRPWLQLRTACAHAGTASAWMQDRIVETTETASEEPSGICMAAISHIGEQANDAVNSINFAAFHRCLVAERLARAAVAAARRVAAHNERGTRSNLAAARCPRSAKYREKHRHVASNREGSDP